MMRCPTALALAWSLICCCMARGAARVAIIAPQPSPAMQNVVALAEARLGEDRGLALVERQQIQKLLAEQAASLAGIIQGDRAVAAGKALSADLLVVVESDPKTPSAGGVVIFDAAAGVRLWDAALSPQEGEKAAASLVSAISGSAAKRAAVGRDLKAICLMSVRNADMPRSMDGFCDAAGRLLERQMIGCPAVAVLERSRLEQINKERTVAPNAAGGELLASVITVDLEVGRGEGGAGLRAVALLADAAGKSIGRASAQFAKEDASALAQALGEELGKQLKTAAATRPLDVSAEAARFCREAMLLSGHQDYVRAVPAAEAAHALQPENLVYHAMLARTLVECGHAIYPWRWSAFGARGDLPKLPRVHPDDIVPQVRRGAEMMLGVALQVRDEPAPVKDPVEMHLSRCWKTLTGHLEEVLGTMSREAGGGAAPAPGKDMAALQAILRSFDMEVLHREALQALARPSGWMGYCGFLSPVLYDAQWVYSTSSRQWSEDHVRLAEEFLKLRDDREQTAGRYSKEVLLYLASSWQAHRRNNVIITERGPTRPRVTRWALDDSDYQRLGGLAQRMLGHRDPGMQLYGQLALHTIEVDRCWTSPQKVSQCIGEFIGKIKAVVADPKTADDAREVAYQVMAEAARKLDGTPLAGSHQLAILEFMLSRKEFEESVFNASRGRPGGADDPRREPLRARALELINSPDCKILASQSNPGAMRNYYGKMAVAAPQPRPPAADWQWHTIVDVFDADDGLQWVFCPIAEKQAVYVAGVSVARGRMRDGALQLLRYEIPSGRVTALGKTALSRVNITKQAVNDRWNMHLEMSSRSVCLHQGRYYIAYLDGGIWSFPLDGGAPELIDKAKGLPSDKVQAVAAMDGKLYASLGVEGAESYIVAYDPKARTCDVLASSLRKDKRSPFDDGRPFHARYLAADPARNRILAVVQRAEDPRDVSGIWTYLPASGQWKCLIPLPPAGRGLDVTWGTQIQDDMIVFTKHNTQFLLSMKEDRLLNLFMDSAPSFRGMPAPSMEWHRPAWAKRRFQLRTYYPPYCLEDQWLLANVHPEDPRALEPQGPPASRDLYGLAAIGLEDGAREVLPLPRSQGQMFWASFLQRIAPRQWLVADNHGLFVLARPPAGDTGK